MPTLPVIPTDDRDPFKSEMDQQTLEKCLRYWVKELHLTDWQIDAEFGDKYKTSNNAAEIQRSNSLRLAEIFIMTKEAFDEGGRWAEYDAEVLLVHELLHLVLWQYTSGSEMDGNAWLLERSIETLAYCLVDTGEGYAVDNDDRWAVGDGYESPSGDGRSRSEESD